MEGLRRFAALRDGRFAEPPIAPAEVQGYVYDAKRRLAELARVAWSDEELAGRLEHKRQCSQRFDEAFWVADRGGYYALALDGTSGGRLAVLEHRSSALERDRSGAPRRRDRDALMRCELWSGWGIRTMSTSDPPTALWLSQRHRLAARHGPAALGLHDTGSGTTRGRLCSAVPGGGWFDWSLPEVFAGFSRRDTPFPIAYPTAARPQAWAAGTPILLLRLLLGLEPDLGQRALTSRAPAELPPWAGEIRLRGIQAFGQSWDADLVRGAVRVLPGSGR